MFGRNKCFWYYHFSTRLIYAIQNNGEIRTAVQIGKCALLRWCISRTETDSSADPTGLMLIKQKSHSNRPYHGIRHLIVIDCRVKLFRALEIGNWNFEPGDGVVKHFHKTSC